MSGESFFTQSPPAADAAAEETDADRREREAARLDIAPAQPGEEPPTHGDEGGGNLFPDQSCERSRPLFFPRFLAAALGLPAAFR